MKRRYFISVLASSAVCWLSVGGFAESSSVRVSGIPRFAMVTEYVFRGGQPTGAGFAYLRQRGIRTVINLRKENDEKAEVEGLGMRYVHLPTSAWDPMPEQVVESVFRIINDPSAHPVFIHCRRGADRTGAMIGLFRIAFQGWDGKKAYQEARAMGMRWWYRDLKKQLYEFAGRDGGTGGLHRAN
ncbi:MAG: tyrosine-protein phosphatase [Terriglobia bacterium]